MAKIEKIFLTALIGVLGCLGLLATGCSDGADNKQSNCKPEYSVELLKTLTLTLGDEAYLSPRYDEIEGYALSYNSSAPAVASVDEKGLVKALTLGETTVQVSYGEKTADCLVTVSLSDKLPKLDFKQSVGEKITVAMGNTFDFGAHVLFNGKAFSDGELNYTLDKNIGSFDENGVFTPTAKDTATLTVSAAWRGVETDDLMKTLELNVVDAVELFVNDGSTTQFTLYTLDSHGGVEFGTQLPFVVTSKINGNVANAEISIAEGVDVVEFDGENGVLKAKKEGVATIALKVQVGDKVLEKICSVTVTKPTLSLAPIQKFSAYDGDFDFSFLAEGEEIVSAMQGETVLTADSVNNKLMGVVPNFTAMNDQETVVYTGTDVFGNANANPGTRKVNPVTIAITTNKAIYNFEVTAYTRVIKTAEQLSMFDVAWGNPFMTTRAESISQTELTTGEKGGYYIDGYYLLGNDIENLTWTPNKHAASGALNIAFMGVFDGNGHTLHVKAGAKGLFGWAFRACIKNTNFIFEEQSGTAGSVGLADRLGMGQWKGRCVVSNVSVTINNFGAGSEKGVYSAALVNRADSQIAFENVKVNLNYADGFTATEKTTGLIALRAYNFAETVSITVTESAASGAPIVTDYAAGKPETLTAKYWASNDGKTTDDGTIIAGAIREIKK